jgi:FlaA1/EpsC-like NDP-sugar epimerase
MFNNASILATGGTGSWGKKFAEMVLRNYNPRRLILFSRDEHKRVEIRPGEKLHKCMIGVDDARQTQLKQVRFS